MVKLGIAHQITTTHQEKDTEKLAALLYHQSTQVVSIVWHHGETRNNCILFDVTPSVIPLHQSIPGAVMSITLGLPVTARRFAHTGIYLLRVFFYLIFCGNRLSFRKPKHPGFLWSGRDWISMGVWLRGGVMSYNERATGRRGINGAENRVVYI